MRIFHTAVIEARLVGQLVRSERLLLLRLSVHMVELERVHVLEMVLVMLLEVVMHLRLKGVEGGGWMSSMQTTVHSSLRSRHG
jgi:hypothetical protein